jgi:hypothetical protein
MLHNGFLPTTEHRSYLHNDLLALRPTFWPGGIHVILRYEIPVVILLDQYPTT